MIEHKLGWTERYLVAILGTVQRRAVGSEAPSPHLGSVVMDSSRYVGTGHVMGLQSLGWGTEGLVRPMLHSGLGPMVSPPAKPWEKPLA